MLPPWCNALRDVFNRLLNWGHKGLQAVTGETNAPEWEHPILPCSWADLSLRRMPLPMLCERHQLSHFHQFHLPLASLCSSARHSDYLRVSHLQNSLLDSIFPFNYCLYVVATSDNWPLCVCFGGGIGTF